jgi:hypothetical protein
MIIVILLVLILMNGVGFFSGPRTPGVPNYYGYGYGGLGTILLILLILIVLHLIPTI